MEMTPFWAFAAGIAVVLMMMALLWVITGPWFFFHTCTQCGKKRGDSQIINVRDSSVEPPQDKLMCWDCWDDWLHKEKS